VVVVVGGGEVVVVVLGATVGWVFEVDWAPSLPDDCCGAGATVVEVEVEVGGTVVVALAGGAVVLVPVVAAEVEPGRSCATTTPISAVKPVAARAVSLVRRLTRRWARSLTPSE
jgi:hypothetical protein